MNQQRGGIGKGCLIASGIGCGLMVLLIASCVALGFYGKAKADQAASVAKAKKDDIDSAKTPEQKKAELALKDKQWAFIQKHWMTRPGAMFYQVQDHGGGLVIAQADLRWYAAPLDEKKLATEAIWSYFFKGGDENGFVEVDDARSGKKLATCSKDFGLQMED